MGNDRAFGAQKHQMSMRRIDEIYYDLIDFFSDCTRDELEGYRDAIAGVKALMQQRIRDARR